MQLILKHCSLMITSTFYYSAIHQTKNTGCHTFEYLKTIGHTDRRFMKELEGECATQLEFVKNV